MRSCLSLFVLAGLLVSPATSSAGNSTNAVAVVDFEMADARADSKDWAFGLADMLAMELQRRGVVLFERQQIRMVLGERQITAASLIQLGEIPSQEIPDIKYLITGIVRPLTNQQFQVETSLVDTRTGRNVESFSRQGHYPKELPAALTALADQIGDRLKLSGVTTMPVRAKPHLTRKPEVALLFYKGIAHCLVGQPEMGVTWFIDAYGTEPHFLAARVWAMRAFQMIGLPDFAAVARAKVMEAPNGPSVLNRLNEARLLDQDLISVAVISDPRLESDGWQLRAGLKKTLGGYTNFFVADPSNIRSLATEMDLQLTEKGGSDLELASVLWSAMDALVWLRPTEDAGGKFIAVELHDALSGEVLFRTRTLRDASQVTQIGRDLAEHVSAQQKAALSATHHELKPNSVVKKPVQVSNTDRHEFAGLLKYIASNPLDRAALVRLTLFVRWLGGRDDGRYHGAISDRIVAATDLKEPDAAHWISTALWHRRYYEKPQPIATQFATLLEHFPESPEAHYARSALALELIDNQKYAEAAEMFARLREELPRLPKDVKIGPDYWANFYFFTAVALDRMGDKEQARKFLDQADEVLRKNPDLVIFDYAKGIWVNHFPQYHPLFGPQKDLFQAVAEWKARLAPVHGNDGKKMTLEQLELLLTEATESSEKDATPKRLNFLQRLIEHKQFNPVLYQGRITESVGTGPYRKVNVWQQGPTYGHFTLPAKLVMEAIVLLSELAAGSPKESAEARRLTVLLADKLEDSIAARCFEAVGDYEKALRKVDEAIRNPSPFPTLSWGEHPTRQQIVAKELRQQKIRLLQQLGKSAEAAAYAGARAKIPEVDADAKLAATIDAAEAHVAIKRTDEACRFFAEFVRAGGPPEAMNESGAVARIHWAELEIARGNLFEASALLREVVQHSEGKDWGISLRFVGYVSVYKAALTHLAKIRSQTPAQTLTR